MICAVIRMDPAGTRPGPFGKYHQVLPLFEYTGALINGLPHRIPVTAPLDGNAFEQIAEEAEHNTPIKIRMLRHIPRYQAILQHIPVYRKQGMGQDKRIDQGQMIGADQPWTGVRSHHVSDLPADAMDIPDPVSGELDGADD